MIYYSNYPSWVIRYVKSFSNTYNLQSLNIDVENYQFNSEDSIFFIPIYGEEELNSKWLFFFESFANNKNNIDTRLFIYLFGIYDYEIHSSSTIIKQIDYYTRFLSLKKYIYPLKISADRVDLNDMLYFYNHNLIFKNIKRPFGSLIKKITFDTKSNLLEFNEKVVNFIRKEDEFSSILERLPVNRKLYYLKNIFCLCNIEKLILNRTVVDEYNLDIFDIENDIIKQLSIKSATLKKIPSLKKLSSLHIINLTANQIEEFDIKYFPKSIYFINLSKNRIHTFLIDSNEYINIKRLSFFNNKLQNLKGIEFLTNLEYLNIGFNKFKVFPDELRSLKRMKHLNISFLEIKEIPKYILEWNELEVLDITGCKYLDSDKIIESLKNKGVIVIC